MAVETVPLLVPVSRSSTIRNTVAFSVSEAKKQAEDAAAQPAIHFVYLSRGSSIAGGEASSQGEELLERVRLWAQEDADDTEIALETATLGSNQYLFSPGDYATVTLQYAKEQDISSIIIDPEYQPGGNAPMLRSFELELTRSDVTVIKAPVERTTVRSELTTRASVSKFVFTFLLVGGFYLLIAGSLKLFELLTGAVTATIVAAGLSNVVFGISPSPLRTFQRVLRLLIYIPYLLWEITKANIEIAYIILHPSLPIDPEMSRFKAAVSGSLPVTVLANSITLTPGTLTVDVDSTGLYIHSLTESARDSLEAGGLERAVRFVFYGRKAARIPSPLERERPILSEDAESQEAD
jgi:multicomponent Na+:H+ antiporter subunit E